MPANSKESMSYDTEIDSALGTGDVKALAAHDHAVIGHHDLFSDLEEKRLESARVLLVESAIDYRIPRRCRVDQVVLLHTYIVTSLDRMAGSPSRGRYPTSPREGEPLSSLE